VSVERVVRGTENKNNDIEYCDPSHITNMRNKANVFPHHSETFLIDVNPFKSRFLGFGSVLCVLKGIREVYPNV
jgi:hypothetical protein